MLRLQLGQLDVEPAYERLRKQVQEIASALLEQTSIPAIREQQQLLDEVAGDEWWQDVTLPMLELLRRRMRSLVKLIERSCATSPPARWRRDQPGHHPPGFRARREPDDTHPARPRRTSLRRVPGRGCPGCHRRG